MLVLWSGETYMEVLSTILSTKADQSTKSLQKEQAMTVRAIENANHAFTKANIKLQELQTQLQGLQETKDLAMSKLQQIKATIKTILGKIEIASKDSKDKENAELQKLKAAVTTLQQLALTMEKENESQNSMVTRLKDNIETAEHVVEIFKKRSEKLSEKAHVLQTMVTVCKWLQPTTIIDLIISGQTERLEEVKKTLEEMNERAKNATESFAQADQGLLRAEVELHALQVKQDNKVQLMEGLRRQSESLQKQMDIAIKQPGSKPLPAYQEDLEKLKALHAEAQTALQKHEEEAASLYEIIEEKKKDTKELEQVIKVAHQGTRKLEKQIVGLETLLDCAAKLNSATKFLLDTDGVEDAIENIGSAIVEKLVEKKTEGSTHTPKFR